MPVQSTPRPWSRYVAIGDSFSEGLNDAYAAEPTRFYGWTDRLSVMLAGVAAGEGRTVSYANLAIRGRLLHRIVTEQLDAALALGPDLLTISAGGNDLLRPGADPDALAAELDEAVGRARDAGTDVVLMTSTDPRGAGLIQRTGGMVALFAAHVWTIGSRRDCYVTDLFGLRSLMDARLWSEDRLHLTSDGHARVAAEVFHTLGHTPPPGWREPLAEAPARARSEVLREDVAWVRTHLAPWVHRRLTGRSSGDGITPKRPQLVPIDPGQALPPLSY